MGLRDILRRARIVLVTALLSAALGQLPVAPASSASYLVDNVQMTVSSAPGTGTITLGAAVAGHQSISTAGVPNGSTVSYLATDTGNVWEVGHAIYNSSSGTLGSRTPLWGSSGANTAVSLSSAAIISLDALAEDLNLYAPLNSNYGSGFVDKFRNAEFDVWQRGTSALSASTTITAAPSYTADGWIAYAVGAAATCLRASAPSSIPELYVLECQGAASNTDIIFGQRIESYLAAPLAGQTVTVQFRYYQNSGSSQTPKVSTCYATTADTWDGGTNKFNCANNSDAATDLAATSLTACATATWCVEAYTFTVGANAINGYEVDFDCNAAFASSSVECEIGAADIRTTPGLSTGITSNPPAPELRNVQAEIDLSRRYYFAANASFSVRAFSSGSGGSGAAMWYLPYAMRAVPTMSGSSWSSLTNCTGGSIVLGTDGRTVTSTLTSSGAYGFSGTLNIGTFSAEL